MDRDRFNQLARDPEGLSSFDPRTLETREERLAFWLNLYNFYYCRADAGGGTDPDGILDRHVCAVAGRRYSLGDIEHGVLRGNARMPYRLWRRLPLWDRRRTQALERSEPLAGFALEHVRSQADEAKYFEPIELDGILYQVAVDYLENGGITIDRERREIVLSRLLHDYSRDFGGGQAMLAFVVHHLRSPEDAAWIRSWVGKARIRFR